MKTFKFNRFKANTKTNKNLRVNKNEIILRSGIIVAAIVFCAVFYGMAIFNTPESTAIEPSSFNAGRIIDDSVFYNANTMTVEEIQAFLDSKSPACDMWGTGLITGRNYPDGTRVPSGTTRAQYAKTMREKYGRSRYHDPPYVCLNKYYENPETHQSLYDTNGVAQPGMRSVSQIIYNAAQKYSINPQVLIVMLKKESSVWGDNWPLKDQFNTVMGYGCPDTAPCSEQYFGFYNQVEKAAWQLKYYREHPNSYNYRVGMTNNIQYHPNYSCGTKQVYIENIATASLYIYTPYTPNDAALRAYPGTGDSCSSYGNRNFYAFFTEWFGSTYENVAYVKIMNVYKDNVDILGNIVSRLYESNNGSYWIEFKNGFIMGSSKTGFYVSLGKIRDVWASAGYETGRLGYPISNIISTENGGSFQEYENGYIVGSSDIGYSISYKDMIREVWASTGYELGVLGYPISDVYRSSRNSVTFQEYENGYIIGAPKTGYFVSMKDKIREAWGRYGYEVGSLGLPTSNVILEATYSFQKFEHGYVYLIDGNIYIVPIELASSERYSDIGTPISMSVSYNNGANLFQQFENGYIVGSKKTGFYSSLYGGIRDYWASTGYEAGRLGLPIGNVKSSKKIGVTYQAFQNGYIIGDDYGFSESLNGVIRDYWASTGYELGKLGLPRSKIYINKKAKSTFQMYDNGYIIGSIDTGYHASMFGCIRDSWGSTGFEEGVLGLPTSDEYEIENGEKLRQDFKNGHIECVLETNNCKVNYK